MPVRTPAALLPSFHAQPTLLRGLETAVDENDHCDGVSVQGITHPADPEPLQTLADDDRYAFTGHIGVGSSAHVYRVRDLRIERLLAMKVLRPELAHDNGMRERFLAEAQAMARLQHPGILPVYDVGELQDGRPFFTMQEVSGENLGQLLHRRQQEPSVADQWSTQRLLSVVRQACAIVAFAHARDMLHLDIKPENILIGEQDAVYVVDWGLTQESGALQPELRGTPAYLAPEQVLPTGQPLDARVDVYGLGAVLYQVLTGRPPYVGEAAHVVDQVRLRPPPSIQDVASQVPAPLAQLVARALSRTPSQRYASAKELGLAVGDWLDGSDTRRRVVRLLELAASRVEDARLMERQAAQLRSRVGRLKAQVSPWSPEDAKHRYWDLEDRAGLLEREARFKLLERRELLHAAASQAPEVPEPHAALAEVFRLDHDAAERSGDEAARRMAEERLREQLAALPEDHPTRQVHLGWLKGMGSLSLSTTVPDAELHLERYANHRRKLRVVPVRKLGDGRIDDVELPMGSYRLRIQAPGHAEVLHPIRISRGQHWRSARGGAPPCPVYLPRPGELGPDDRYVPAGWASISDGRGGMTDVWVDGFVVRALPVTNGAFLEFLHALVDCGRPDVARRFVPRLQSKGHTSHATGGTWTCDASGRYTLPQSDAIRWRADAPVVGVTWKAAMAFAAWESQRTGLEWRLPHEVEWEKAARGVDGRRFPWGAGADASRACIWSSRPTPDGPASVEEFAADVSPYGVRQLAGNVHEWCANAYTPEVPLADGGLTWPDPDAVDLRCARGASWRSRDLGRALSQRQGLPTDETEDRVGFRLARLLPGTP